jgi:transposase
VPSRAADSVIAATANRQRRICSSRYFIVVAPRRDCSAGRIAIKRAIRAAARR